MSATASGDEDESVAAGQGFREVEHQRGVIVAEPLDVVDGEDLPPPLDESAVTHAGDLHAVPVLHLCVGDALELELADGIH